MANSKLPSVAIAAMIERIKVISPEVTDLTEFLTAQGVDVPAVLAGAAPEPSGTSQRRGMSPKQRKALSEKMKARHAANKAAKEAEQGGTPGGTETAGINLNPTAEATPAAPPA